ncbi:MAG: hypothetical protein ACYC6B_04175 [Thermoleophilia bacterium]
MVNQPAKVALLWDSSYLWGLIAYRTLRGLGVDFDLLGAAEIRDGGLTGHDIIFVPGGWASDKFAALGDEGVTAMQGFVAAGGGYLGLCGGAGLALSHDSGLGLAPFGRLPASVRLPSFSGRISLDHSDASHPMWHDIDANTAFYAWWPGQFALEPDAGVRVLASYGQPQAGSFVTDLPLGPTYDWAAWEQSYGINLDPDRITGEPAVVELNYGKGTVILSYLHFETPSDTDGHRVLLNLISYLAGGKTGGLAPVTGYDEVVPAGSDPRLNGTADPGADAAAVTRELEQQARDFITFGRQNFLWSWRNDWLLQWRRGVKGIEYSAICGMVAELRRLTEIFEDSLDQETRKQVSALPGLITPFLRDARELIMRERFAMNHGPISPLRSDDAKINSLRATLFSSNKRCGGLYEEIMTQIDALLLPLLQRESGS